MRFRAEVLGKFKTLSDRLSKVENEQSQISVYKVIAGGIAGAIVAVVVTITIKMIFK